MLKWHNKLATISSNTYFGSSIVKVKFVSENLRTSPVVPKPGYFREEKLNSFAPVFIVESERETANNGGSWKAKR